MALGTAALHSPCVLPFLSWSPTRQLLTLFADIANTVLAAAPNTFLDIPYIFSLPILSLARSLQLHTPAA